MKFSRAAARLGTIALFAIVAGRLPAQAPDTSSVDHIAAVVGSHAITTSQVQEELFARVGNGLEHLPDQTKDPGGYAKALAPMMRRYVDTLVAFELLLQEASADTSIKVTDQEVGDAADQLINNARKGFKSETEFIAGLKDIGFSTAEDWRSSLLEKQRRSLTVRRFQEQLQQDNKIKPMAPTEKEMRAFYDAHVSELGSMPASVYLTQIVVSPKPTDAAKATAKKLADSLVTALRAGADFATLARRFSMDEQSRADGGNLNWFRRGEMVREFEDVAFSLKVGQVSDPVESPFGYHIIQVQRESPGEVQARHILIIPDVDSAAAKAAHDKAVEISGALKKGASFDSLQHLYHDRSEGTEFSGYPIDSLAHTPYGPAIEHVDSGQVSDAFELPAVGHPLRSKWAVVRVTRRTLPGPRAYDDLKEQIRKIVGIQLGESDYINQLRSRTYVDIREP